MRPGYVAPAGVSKFSNRRPVKAFQSFVVEGYDAALLRLDVTHPTLTQAVDAAAALRSRDRFNLKLMFGNMAQDYLRLVPKRRRR